MSICWRERLRTMGPRFSVLTIFQILCCTLVSSEFQSNAMKDKFVQSQNGVLRAVWSKEPSIICNIPKPPEAALENKMLLTFSFDQLLCVILYDISNRYERIQSVELSSADSEKLVPSIVANPPLPHNFCQKMKNNVWSTDTEENSKWLQKFSKVMNNPTSCNKYCVADDIVNPLCAYILWLDSSMKVKLHEKSVDDPKLNTSLPYPVIKQQMNMERKKLQDYHTESHHEQSAPSNIQNNLFSLPESHNEPDPTTVPLTGAKSSTNVNEYDDHSKSNTYLLNHHLPVPVTGTGIESPQTNHNPKLEDSRGQYQPSSNHSPIQVNQHNPNLADVVSAMSEAKNSKPNIPLLKERRLPTLSGESKLHVSPGDEEVPRFQPIDERNFSNAPENKYTDKLGSANTAVSNNALQHKTEISSNGHDEILIKNNQYSGKNMHPLIPTNGAIKNEKSENTVKIEYSKTPENAIPVVPEAKQTLSGTDVSKKESIEPSESIPPKPDLPIENGNAADEGTSDVGGAIEPDNHENPKDMEETEGRDDAENPEDQSEIMDATSPTHFVGDNDSPPLKPNTSPKISEYGDDLSDEDPAIPMNADQEKGTLNDADAGIYVHDRFVDAEDSHFFAYFMTMIILCILGYLIFHNKQKILALALEGRVRKGNRRRPSTSGYRKLDSNLEEAVTSNCSGASVTHVIY